MSASSAVRLSDRAVQAILDSAPDGIVVLDAAGTIVLVNGMTEQLSGYCRDELIGRPYDALLPPDITLGVPSKSREIVLRRNDGGEADVEVVVNAISDDDGLYSVVAIRDIRERTRLREQLIVSDRMVSIGTLAAGVAHEINNPLAAVIANLDLALEELASHPDGLEDIDEILRDARDASDRVRQIVRDLRMFSRVDEDKLGTVDVNRVLESTLRMARTEIRHRARLVEEYAPVPPVRASEARLGQVFLNIVVNAVHAIPHGHADRNEIRVSTSIDGRGDVVIAIADTGAGMTTEVKRRLFMPFFSTKPIGQGTGLGLSIAHRLVSSFGGHIEVGSTPGHGSVFRIVLPAIAHAQADPDAALVSAMSSRRGRVLVVDDDPMIGRVVRRMLVDHDVLSVTRAREALDRLAAGESFDLILCDLMMPEVTGMELYETLCRDAPAQAERVIFMTGGAFTTTARDFLARTTQLQLEKPFDAEQLRAVVSERLR